MGFLREKVLAMLKFFWLVLGLYFSFFTAAFAQGTSEEMGSYMAQCEQGNALSCRKVATIGSELNQSEKLHYLEKACELGDEISCFMPRIAFDINSEKERAIQVAQEYCNLGNGYACFMLASLHAVWGTETTDRVINLFNSACALENSLACTALAAFYLTGGEGSFQVEVNAPRGLELLNAACELQTSTSFKDDFIFSMGDSACAEYASILIDGEYIEQDYTGGLNLLLSSCDNGDRSSCHLLGDIYDFGRAGVTVDLVRAYHFYKLACNMGDANGCFSLAMYYEYSSNLTNKDYYAAQAYLQACQLEDRGNNCLRAGDIIASRNPFEAKVAYEVGCSKQYYAVENCLRLAEFYERGVGVRKSLSNAIEFYGRACDLRSQMGCENYARLN